MSRIWERKFKIFLWTLTNWYSFLITAPVKKASKKVAKKAAPKKAAPKKVVKKAAPKKAAPKKAAKAAKKWDWLFDLK